MADNLNGMAADLRVRGTRGTPRYDPARLQRWLLEQETSGGGNGQGSCVLVRVSASWDGMQWTVWDASRSISATGPRLAAAQRSVATQIARLLQIGSHHIQFEVAFERDHAAMLAWSEAEAMKARANEVLNALGCKRLEAIDKLMSEGVTIPEIGDVVGMSYQRTQAIVSNAKTKQSTSSSSCSAPRPGR